VVEWTAVEPVLHRVQDARGVAFHDEGYVGVQRAERTDLEVGGYVGVVDEGGVCSADVLDGVLLECVQLDWIVLKLFLFGKNLLCSR
jgi:hypothetical protein